MLDFDYACTREQPSVACIVDPFNNAPRKDFYWGSKQLFVPSMYIYLGSYFFGGYFKKIVLILGLKMISLALNLTCGYLNIFQSTKL